MGSAIEPDSLAGAVRYAYDVAQVPILVTEHGMSTDDDTLWAAFIEPSLVGLLDVVADGVPVLGYTHWTLMDTFEWVFGYGHQLGLHEVDRETFERTPEPSARGVRRSRPGPPGGLRPTCSGLFAGSARRGGTRLGWRPVPNERRPMTRYVVDAGVVLQLVSAEIVVAAGNELLAPTLLRSQTLALLHQAVHDGDLAADVARARLARVGRMKIRLLGDGVLRRRAWEVADDLGWATTYAAEYVALTQLQADAYVTLDADLARQLDGVVAVATVADLQRPG